MANDATVILRKAGNETASTFPEHTLLLHTYEVERLLAYGGMGEVYLARHTELGTRHAVKIIKPGLIGTAGGQDILALFRREAATLRGIRHDAVVSYDGFFRDETKTCYLVMEYVDGPSLSQVLKQRALSVDEVFRLRDRLAAGLAFAHERGVTHRDLSPDNVILPNGLVEQAKLIDFGIAKLADPTVATIIGKDFAGKLRYAAPEQLGLFGGKVGPVSDIYSLGLVLAAAVLGTPLPMGESLASAIAARQQVPALAQVPAALQPLLHAMLQPDPNQRVQSATVLRQDWLTPHVMDGLPPPPRLKNTPAGRGYYWLAMFAAVGVAGWLAGAWMWRLEPESPAQAIQHPVLEKPQVVDTSQAEGPGSVTQDRPVTTAEPSSPTAMTDTPEPATPTASTMVSGDHNAADTIVQLPHTAPPQPTGGEVEDRRLTQPVPLKPSARSERLPMDRPAPSAEALPVPEPAPTPIVGTAGGEAIPAVTERPVGQDETPGPTPPMPAVVGPASTPGVAVESGTPSSKPPLTEPSGINRIKPLPSSVKRPAKPPPKSQEAPRQPPASPQPRSLAKEKAKPAPKTGPRSLLSGGSKPAGCGSVLLKSQIGEPLSAADRALLQKGCR
jgi:serine/threonine protein kinase